MLSYYNLGYYKLKDDEWLENQRIAGKVLSLSLEVLHTLLVEGVSTKQISLMVESVIIGHKCQPTFKGYKGFPEAACISINNEIVHGIPSEDRIIKNGDIVKIDSGATYKGAIADMAITIGVGEISAKNKLLIDTCKKCLDDTIKNIIPNKSKLGDIGYRINKTAKSINANVITDLGGHGLDIDTPHMYPFVSNVGEKDKGILLRGNTTLCIEPMITYGSNKIRITDDKWTVVLNDIGVHFEKTIFIHEDRVEVITEA